MKNNNVLKRVCSCLTVLLLIASCTACGNSGQSTDMTKLVKEKVNYTALREKGSLKPDAAQLEDKILAQENDWLAMYYNEKTAVVSIFDKRSGLWWQTNPDDPQNAAAKSQLSISTISSQGVVKQYSSYTDSLSKNQVEFETNQGLKVTYTFGTPKPNLSNVPEQLTEERFDELNERVISAGGDKSLLKRRYIKKDNVWVRMDGLTTDQAKKLRELFDLIEYTEDEYKEDSKISVASTETEEDDSIVISLNYALEGDSLTVSVPCKDIVYPSNAIITSLEVLEYFGALKKDSEGWIFIPDGSGALVDTSAREGTTGYVSMPLYGRDDTLPQTAYSPIGKDCLLPVFGFSRTGGGMFTVIEDSQAVASIQVAKPGFLDEYATASAVFALNAAQNVGLSSDSISKFYITSNTKYEGDASLRYIFLQNNDSSYSGMASVYRDYLDLSGKRSLQDENGELPFFLETVGAIKTDVSTAGFVHSALVPLTEYQDNITLIEKLRERGVGNIKLILKGWMNGGADPEIADEAKLINVLGGKNGFNKLTNWAESNNVSIYPEVLLNTFSSSSGINKLNKYSSKSLDNKKSYLSTYDIVTGSEKSTGRRYILSPTWQSYISEKLLKSLGSLNITGVSLGDISSTVYSDYSESNEALREAAYISSGKIVENYSNQLSDLMLKAPNDLTARFGTVYTDVPKSSSSLSIAYCSVPFYQMIYHGYATYSFEAMNYDSDFMRSMLTCAEYGGCPKFQFIAKEDSRLNFVDDAEYYASYYERWIESAEQAYKFLNELLTPVQNAKMIAHSAVSNGVYRTDYDNGYSIYVNYNESAVNIGGITVEGLSAVRKGE